MKKIGIIIFLLCTSTWVNAQSRERAIGGNIGQHIGFSYQHLLDSSRVLDCNLDILVDKVGGFGGTISHDWLDPFHAQIPRNHKGDWHWLLGVGGSLGLYGFDGNPQIYWGAAMHCGVEYNFEKTPLQLSIDWHPVIGGTTHYTKYKNWHRYYTEGLYGISLGIRYLFPEEKTAAGKAIIALEQRRISAHTDTLYMPHTRRELKNMGRSIRVQTHVAPSNYFSYQQWIYNYYNATTSKRVQRREFSLHDVDSTLLNETDKKLLSEYFDVYVNPSKLDGYLVVDSEMKIGLADKYGLLVNEPLPGRPLFLPNDIIGLGSGDGMRNEHGGVGSFMAVVNKKEMKTIADYHTYDKIEGDGLFKQFLVCQIKDGKEQWGTIGLGGYPIYSCSYSGVIVNQYGVVDLSSTYTSDELRAIYQKRAEAAAQTVQSLQATYDALNQMYENVTKSKSSSSNNSGSSTSSSSSNKSNTSNTSSQNGTQWANDCRVYQGWEDVLRRMKSGSAPYDDNLRRQAQASMRRIRTKWEAQGRSMYHSDLEDWLGK